MEDKLKEYAQNSIDYFRAHFIAKGTEINYQILEDDSVKFKVPKDLYNDMTASLEKEDFDFEIIPQERKMELNFPRYNGKKLLKTKPFKFYVYFVDSAALKTVESIKDKSELNIKTWAEFFETIDPEYRNTFKQIIDTISIATHKNEYNKVISKKTYWIDYQNGLFEKKEKFVNGEWNITYQPVTTNLFQVFRMFFKFFDEIPLNELADYTFFKEIVSKTKYKNYLV